MTNNNQGSYLKKLILASALCSTIHLSFAQGNLENPVAGSTESGIGVISGWYCTATNITVTVDGASLGKAGSGTSRGDTASTCGRSNTGYALLFNYNDLTPGSHNISVFADNQLLETRQFNTVRSGGVPFATGLVSGWSLSNFPSAGETASIDWSQAKQSFVVTSISGSKSPTPLTLSVQAAMANLVNKGFSKPYILTGWVDHSTINKPVPQTPITGSGTLTVGSPTMVTFTGGPLVGSSSLQSVAVMTGTTTGTATTYYRPTDYTILATYDERGTYYYSPYSYPATVHAGSTGLLGNGSREQGGNVTTTYVVASETTNTLLVSIMQNFSGTIKTQTVYRIDTSGGVNLVSNNVQYLYLNSVYQSLTYTFQ